MSKARIAHALAYPFAPRPDAFVFENGQARVFDAERDGALLEERVPILATGSNASPQRLLEKFGPGHAIAVTRAVVPDHVVAHSAKFAAYASIPATLHRWEGARVRVHVTWLTAPQLEIMDETETLGRAYDRVGVTAEFLDAPSAAPAQVYVSRSGALSLDGAVVSPSAALLEHQCAGPVRLDQRAAQECAMRILELDGPVEDFIAENLADAELRARRSAQLSERAGLPYAPSRA